MNLVQHSECGVAPRWLQQLLLLLAVRTHVLSVLHPYPHAVLQSSRAIVLQSKPGSLRFNSVLQSSHWLASRQLTKHVSDTPRLLA